MVRITELRLQKVLLVALFLAALAVRLYRIEQLPQGANATREYHGALGARRYYYNLLDNAAPWRKDLAALQAPRLLEPPIMETLSAVGFLATGGENWWVPRLLATVFWLAGGIALYLLAQKVLTGPNAALLSVAFYLFFPFGVSTGRNFQPEALMLLLQLFSVLAIVRFNEEPSRRRLLVACLLASVAILVKPTSLFVILGTMTCLTVQRLGLWKAAQDRQLWAFALLSLVPAGAYYSMVWSGALAGQAASSFAPSLFLRRMYYQNWLTLIGRVIGLPALIGALLGILMAPTRRARALFLGMWGGYIALGIVFNFHMATHDYYHLQIIPIAALGLGAVGGCVLERALRQEPLWFSRSLVGVVLVLAFTLLVREGKWQLEGHDLEYSPAVAEQVGEIVHHTPRAVFVANYYGKPLKYYGWIDGSAWPSSWDLQAYELRGDSAPSARDRFCATWGEDLPEYFIVTWFQEYEKQRDLVEFVESRMRLWQEGDGFKIFRIPEDVCLRGA